MSEKDRKEETLAELAAEMGVDACGDALSGAVVGQFEVEFNLDPEYGEVVKVRRMKRGGGSVEVARLPEVRKWIAEHPEVGRAAGAALRLRQEWVRRWKAAHREGRRDADRGCVRLRVGEVVVDLPAGGDCIGKSVYVLRGVKRGEYPWPQFPPGFRYVAGIRGHVEVLSYDCDIDGGLAEAAVEADDPEIWTDQDGAVLVIDGIA